MPFTWRGHTKSLTTRARPRPDLAVWLEYRRRVRRGSVEIAVGAIKTFAKWTVKPMTDGGATPRPLKSEITRQSNVDDVRMWLTTCFMDLELDSSEYTPWVRRFYEEQVDGEARRALSVPL